MKTDLHYYTQKITRTATQPRIRRELHYECGLYKNDRERSPVAALHLDHSCTTPLIKFIAVMAGLMLGIWIVCRAARWWQRLLCCHDSGGGCDCH